MTKLKRKRKNKLLPLGDKLLLRKRALMDMRRSAFAALTPQMI